MVVSLKIGLFQFFPGSPSQKLLDFGTLGTRERRDGYFAIVNRNPVGVTLRGWGSNVTGSIVELMGIDSGNETQILQRRNFSDLPKRRRLHIPPDHFMVFRVGLLTPREVAGENDTKASVFVDTDRHSLDVYFRYRVAHGSLHTVPRELTLEPAFPVRPPSSMGLAILHCVVRLVSGP